MISLCIGNKIFYVEEKRIKHDEDDSKSGDILEENCRKNIAQNKEKVDRVDYQFLSLTYIVTIKLRHATF